jgi:tRNA pseudouridine38-40 synthase
MSEATTHILGSHSFRAFAHEAEKEKHYLCDLYRAEWSELGSFIELHIEANRFLHGMVRTIVGTLLNAQKNNLGKEYISGIINSRERSSASEAVPAKGLFFIK